jgi:hypothetical protein
LTGIILCSSAERLSVVRNGMATCDQMSASQAGIRLAAGKSPYAPSNFLTSLVFLVTFQIFLGDVLLLHIVSDAHFSLIFASICF